MKNTSDILGLVGWLAASVVAGAVGAQFMPGEWYTELAKPAATPPGWVFGPVWTFLYVAMAVAAWLVWRKAGIRGAPWSLSLYLAQLVLNGLWSFLFFGLKQIDLALVDIVPMWLLIATVLVLFWRQNRNAGALMAPYLLWVSFATYLNFAFWRLNG